MSFDCISHWNDDNFKNIGFDNVRIKLWEEARGFREQLEDIRLACPNSEIVYILGNHEDWVKQFANKYTQMQELSIETLLKPQELDIKVIPFGKFHRVGKLYICHGHQFGTENPAKQAVMRCHKSVAFGHHHGKIMWTDYSDIDEKDKHTGILVPCYSKTSPEYGKGRPNRWINGFLFATFDNSGYFYPGIQHVKPDGHFIDPFGTSW